MNRREFLQTTLLGLTSIPFIKNADIINKGKLIFSDQFSDVFLTLESNERNSYVIYPKNNTEKKINSITFKNYYESRIRYNGLLLVPVFPDDIGFHPYENSPDWKIFNITIHGQKNNMALFRVTSKDKYLCDNLEIQSINYIEEEWIPLSQRRKQEK